MGQEQLTLRLARDEAADADAFCSLYNALYRRPVERAYYRWQFFSTPFPTRLHVAVDAVEGPIGFYGVQMRSGPRPGPCTAWCIDIMVRPAFQGRGVFRRLASAALAQAQQDGAELLLVMANRAGAAAHLQGLAWQELASFRDFSAPCRDGVWDAAALRWAWLDEPSSGVENLVPASLRRLVPRTRSYLEWRFRRHPHYRYRQCAAWAGEQLWGYLCLKTFDDPFSGERLGDIVDLGWREDDPGKLAALLGFALDHFAQRGVARACCWLQTGGLLDAVAAEMGFAPTDRLRYFCGQRVGDGLGSDCGWPPTRCLTTMADAELY